MTKKERAEIDAQIAELQKRIVIANRRAALRWTDPVEPDLQPPASGDIIYGWTFNEYTEEVREAWTTSIAHGLGNPRSPSGSQGSLALYSTRALAYRGLRCRVEMNAAIKLMRIDKEIA